MVLLGWTGWLWWLCAHGEGGGGQGGEGGLGGRGGGGGEEGQGGRGQQGLHRTHTGGTWTLEFLNPPSPIVWVIFDWDKWITLKVHKMALILLKLECPPPSLQGVTWYISLPGIPGHSDCPPGRVRGGQRSIRGQSNETCICFLEVGDEILL